MSVHTTHAVPAARQPRWLHVAVAAVAAGLIGAALALAFSRGTHTTAARVSVTPSAPSAAQDARRVPSLMSLSPAQLADGRLGSSYALPAPQSIPTLRSVLASMDPKTRRYTRAVMTLTFAQLAAGAAGSP